MNGRMIAERWLYQKLSTLGVPVHKHPSPEGTAYPNITFGLLTAVDRRVMSDPARVEILTYDISCWDEGSSSGSVNSLAYRVMQTFDGKTPEIVEWTDSFGTWRGIVNGCIRIGAIPISQHIEDGITYQRDGGQFRLEILTE